MLHVSGASHADHNEKRRPGDQPSSRWPHWSGRGAATLQTYAIDTHGLGDVLDPLRAEELAAEGYLVFDVIECRAGDVNRAGSGQVFQPCGDVHAVAVDILLFEDNVAEIDADAELNPLVLRGSRVALGHTLLHFDGATHCLDDARELDEDAVTGGLDDAPVVLLDLRVDQLAAMSLQTRVRSLLVRLRQPAITGDVGGQDRSHPALDVLWFHGIVLEP
jgi:hypothetical protein